MVAGLEHGRMFERDPCRDSGVGDGGGNDRIDAVGQDDGFVFTDQGAFGHHAVGCQRAGVDTTPVVEPGDTVDARDGGQPNLFAGVMVSRH